MCRRLVAFGVFYDTIPLSTKPVTVDDIEDIDE